MTYQELDRAVLDARETVTRGDEAIARLASLMVGRLRVAKVSPYTLAALKKELQDFNSVTKMWSNKP